MSTSGEDPRGSMFTVGRPWGTFQQFATNERVTVKIITVLPGHRLSLQTHGQREEFWHVLEGTATVDLDDATFTVPPEGEVWVPQGARHRISNGTDKPVRLLELAYGEFDEADIVRLEDDYARHGRRSTD